MSTRYDHAAAPARTARIRLTPADRSQELRPWQRAEEMTRCCLYWLPVAGYPLPAAQRQWLMQFLDRWTAAVTADLGLRPEVFLQYKTVYPHLLQPLIDHMLELIPVMGLGRKPGAAIPKFPDTGEIQRLTKGMFDALKRGDPFPVPDATRYMPDYTYWFVAKAERRQRELFLGYGGLSLAFLKPDPKTAPPPFPVSPALRRKLPVLQKFDVEKMRANGAALADSFQARSKELFGAGLEGEPQMKGIPFIWPILDSADFFHAPAELVESCLGLFEVYLRESAADGGVLLAFREDLEPRLIDVLRDMRDQNLMYPER